MSFVEIQRGLDNPHNAWAAEAAIMAADGLAGDAARWLHDGRLSAIIRRAMPDRSRIASGQAGDLHFRALWWLACHRRVARFMRM